MLDGLVKTKRDREIEEVFHEGLLLGTLIGVILSLALFVGYLYW